MKYAYKDIFDDVKRIILKIHPGLLPEKITQQTSLGLNLGIDDLDRIEMIMLAERKFGICITHENEDKLKCATNVADFCTILYNELNQIPSDKRQNHKFKLFNYIKESLGGKKR